jgi:hypothetical protein
MLIGIPIDTYEQSITVSMLFVLSFPSEIAHTTFDSEVVFPAYRSTNILYKRACVPP